MHATLPNLVPYRTLVSAATERKRNLFFETAIPKALIFGIQHCERDLHKDY